MQSYRSHATQLLGAIFILMAPLVFPPGIGHAAKAPETYPEEGKVIATALNQVPVVTYQHTGGPNGGTTMPVRSVRVTRTYTVQTDARTYELDCGKAPHLFSRTPGECGGTKKLQIGDVIHFRIEKGQAYLPVPEAVEPSGEQKLRVLNEELKSDAPPDNTALTPPAKP